MQLPLSMRESLVDDLDEFLGAFSGEPDPEQVAAYVVEQLEIYGEEEGFEDDLMNALEEEGELDGTLQESLETEMASNDEFEYTGEEVISLLERLCGIEWEWDDELDFEDEEEDEDEDEEDEDEDF